MPVSCWRSLAVTEQTPSIRTTEPSRVRKDWKAGAQVRLLGVHASGWSQEAALMDLIDDGRHQRWQQATAAADKLRDRYGESAVSLAASLRGQFRERIHENPVGLPRKSEKKP